MADTIQSFLEEYGQSQPQHIPEQSRSICCCGNEACAYLKHNQSALEGLERDVSTAARLGKVCNFQPRFARIAVMFLAKRTCGSHALGLTQQRSQDAAAFGETS
jgi:hypothetical protein